MEICKVPTLRLRVLNKHSVTHIMYIEMENVIRKKTKQCRHQGIKHNYAKDAHTHTHIHACKHARTLYRLIGVKDNVA